MPILVVGSTGGIGSRVVKKLLSPEFDEFDSCQEIRILCRSSNSFEDDVKTHPRAKFIQGSILKMSDSQIQEAAKDCTAIISGLGHNMTLSGLFGSPWHLVMESAKKLVAAVKANRKEIKDNVAPVKFIWTNTVGVGHPDGRDQKMRSMGSLFVLGLLVVLIAPHRDNYKTSYYFHDVVGKDDKDVAWTCVRPDGLTDEPETQYKVFNALQNGLFSPKVTSRANVAAFMAEIATNDEEWTKWVFEYPVILNAVQKK